jgi:heparosan-N-sulfate-glucuronate 5-epimerase
MVFLGKKRGYQVHPVTVCQVALGWDQQWHRNNDIEAKQMFMRYADWLVTNQRDEPRGGVWPVPYDVGIYGLRTGWISAIVQGQAMSVLSRAYQLTRDNRYLDSAKAAVVPFVRDVQEGGLCIRLPSGCLWYEEYPTTPKSCVLNGFVSSLLGLYDLGLAGGLNEVSAMFWNGVTSLRSSLSLYDTGFWSRYSLFKHPFVSNLASPYYHTEHIAQLRVMARLTTQDIFTTTAERWERYGRSPVGLVRVLCAKVPSRVYMDLVERRRRDE